MSDEDGDKQKKDENVYKCDLCSLSYPAEKDLREHFWSLMHHVSIEQKMKNSLHNCTLCFTACSTLSGYRKHLNGEKHKTSLEQIRIAEEKKEASLKQSRRPNSKQGPPEKEIQPEAPEDKDTEQTEEADTETGGYMRDPIFYKRKKKRPQVDVQEAQTNSHKQNPRWEGHRSFENGFQQNGWVDPSFDYNSDPHSKMYDCHYFQTDFPPVWGRPDFRDPFDNGFGWKGARRRFEGYTDFGRPEQEHRETEEFEKGERDMSWRDHHMGGNWEGYQDSWNNEPWHPRMGNISRKKSFGESEKDSIMGEWKEGWKKNKKKKKWKVNGSKKKNSSLSGDSPDSSNGRKRCRDIDQETTASKTSRLTSNGTGEENLVVSVLYGNGDDANTLSSSLRSTSSNVSKSSSKSRSSSNSPSIRLKSLGTRKLQNTRHSPKGYRVSPKLKQTNRKLRSEAEFDQECSESSGVLERAEKLCKELREKRAKAKVEQDKVMKSKKNEHRDMLNKQIKSLADANQSRIKGHLSTAEKQGVSSKEASGLESGIATFSSSQTSADLSASASSISPATLVSQGEGQPASTAQVFRSDIDRIRHTIESSVRKSNSSPAKPVSSNESPRSAIPKSKRPLSKDSLLKMVNSPRSRNERMQLARMLRSHTKSQNKLAPSRLNVQMNGIYDNYGFDDLDIPAIALEDLSPEVKLQIAQLIEDEVIVDSVELPTSPLPTSKGLKTGSQKLKAMEALSGYKKTRKQEVRAADEALLLDDLKSPEPVVSSENVTVSADSNDNVSSHPVEPLLSVTSVNGVPQLQYSEQIDTSSLQLHPNSSHGMESNPLTRESQECEDSSVPVDLGRQALQMSGLTETVSPVHCSTSTVNLTTTSEHPGVRDMNVLMELSLKEEEKFREMVELDQKMEVMRKMLKRTLEHLEKSQLKRKLLLEDTNKIREQRLKILKDMTDHPSLELPQHCSEPSTTAPANPSSSLVTQSVESMELNLTTDTVSSTSHTQLATSSQTELSPPAQSSSRAEGHMDLATRPVSISTVSAPYSSFTKEVNTNPAPSQPLPPDDRPSSSFAPSCVSIKQERLSPSPEVHPPTSSTSLNKIGDGHRKSDFCSSSPVSTGNPISRAPSSSPSVASFTFGSVLEPEEPKNLSVSGQGPTNSLPAQHAPVVVVSSPNTPNKSNSAYASSEERLASFTNWSPLADRLSCVSGSPIRRTKSVDTAVAAFKPTVSSQNQNVLISQTIKNRGSTCDAENNEAMQLDMSAKESTSSGFCSVSPPQDVPDLERTTQGDKTETRSVRSCTISESTDGDQSRKASNIPMAYLGSISGGVGTAAVLKKLAADLGSLGNVNTMSCVMLDKHAISDKFPSISARLRSNSEGNSKSQVHAGSDVQWMELDLKSNASGKESTPREESEGGSIASNSSLGEKIRKYCQTGDRKLSLDTIEGGGSDADMTLREEEVNGNESPGSDNTPGRILKHCSVVLQKLELEKNGEELPDEEALKVEETVPEVIDLESVDIPEKDASSSLMKGPSSPGRKKRRTKKERDILANRRSYWFDSSSDNNSQEDENVPKLSTLKQQLVFNQNDDNSSEVDQEPGTANSETVAVHKYGVERELGHRSVVEKRVEVAGSSQTDLPLLSRLQPEEADTRVTTPSKPGNNRVNKDTSMMYCGPSESVTSLQVFNNNLYVSYQGQNIRRFNIQSGEIDMVYNCSYHSVQCMTVVSTQGREDCIYAGGLSFHLVVFNVKSPQITNTFELSNAIKCMHYDSGFVYVGLVSGSVEVFDVKNQRHKDSFQCAYQAIHCISSAREGGSKLICVSAQDTTISVCDARSGLPVRILDGHTKTSFSVMSSDHFVFSGSGDRTVMMHNLHTGKLEWTFKNHGGIVTSVWVDGNHLYSAGYDRLIRCFDIKNRCLKRMFYGAGKDVIMNLVVYGDKLYTGNRQGQVECIHMGSESWPCQMSNCQCVFGVRDHLLHHLLSDHTHSTSKVTRCTWKDCSDWLSLHREDGSVECHMRKHVESS